MTPQETRAKLLDLKQEVHGKYVLKQDRVRQLDALRSETTKLALEADVLEKTEQVLLHISTKVLGQSTKNIDKLVSAGLKLVFDDQSLEFRTIMDKSRGKTSLKFELLEGGRSSPIMTSYGGGVLAVAGVLLRVVTITALGLKRVLLLDESLSHLADAYIPNASKLLKKLCKELDFTIVVVTHLPAFAEHADAHYKAVRSPSGTTFQKV